MSDYLPDTPFDDNPEPDQGFSAPGLSPAPLPPEPPAAGATLLRVVVRPGGRVGLVAARDPAHAADLTARLQAGEQEGVVWVKSPSGEELTVAPAPACGTWLVPTVYRHRMVGYAPVPASNAEEAEAAYRALRAAGRAPGATTFVPAPEDPLDTRPRPEGYFDRAEGVA